MSRERLLPLLLIAPLAWAQDTRDEGVFEPGVQHVCVPTADGEGWDCGTAEAPPENYVPPAAEATVETAPEPPPASEPEPAAVAEPDNYAEDTPPPPPFLADPMRDTPYAPVEDATTEPATAAEAVIAAEQTAPPEPAAPATPVPEPEPAPAPIAVAEPEAAPVPEPPAPPAATQPEPEAPPAPEPVVSATSMSTAELGDAAAFANLPAAAFTLQLAYAPTPADFPRLVAALALDPAACYALRVRGANGPTWLLAHGAFADAAAAKAAQARLPRVAGLLAQWPRRIGALQTEISQGQ